MPNTKSGRKRHKQSEKRRIARKATRSSVRSQIKKVHEVIGEKKLEEGEAEFRVAAKKLDQAAAKGMIHKNTASRLKSRLSHAVRNAKQAAKAK